LKFFGAVLPVPRIINPYFDYLVFSTQFGTPIEPRNAARSHIAVAQQREAAARLEEA
jgi:hypothetical protein